VIDVCFAPENNRTGKTDQHDHGHFPSSFSSLAATRIDPIAMLFWTAVINGVVAVPIMFAVMLMISTHSGRRAFPLPRWLRLLGWLASGLMALAVALFAWSSLP
jgi:Mn2+/Fe2+ NRAMP family transporter